MTTSTDHIEKKVQIRAPRSRVWRALTSAEEFGQWFGVKLEAAFTPGARVAGQLTVEGYEHVRFEITIDRIEPERVFSYRWHPYAIDPAVDYSAETPTRVEFALEETADGTTLTVVESGFDQVPAGRRAEAFRMNSNGWGAQMQNIARYVESAR